MAASPAHTDGASSSDQSSEDESSPRRLPGGSTAAASEESAIAGSDDALAASDGPQTDLALVARTQTRTNPPAGAEGAVAAAVSADTDDDPGPAETIPAVAGAAADNTEAGAPADNASGAGVLRLCLEGQYSDLTAEKRDRLKRKLQEVAASEGFDLKCDWPGCVCIQLTPLPTHVIESRFLALARSRDPAFLDVFEKVFGPLRVIGVVGGEYIRLDDYSDIEEHEKALRAGPPPVAAVSVEEHRDMEEARQTVSSVSIECIGHLLALAPSSSLVELVASCVSRCSLCCRSSSPLRTS